MSLTVLKLKVTELSTIDALHYIYIQGQQFMQLANHKVFIFYKVAIHIIHNGSNRIAPYTHSYVCKCASHRAI